MNNSLKVLIFVLLSFAVGTSVSAKNLKIEEISVNMDSIQVVALKERKNILHQNRLFPQYNTFIEYDNKFNRFYIVNIKKSDFLKVLAEVKRVYPSAFRANKKIRKIRKNTTIFVNKPVASRAQIEPLKKVYHDSPFLNSETILKTRKKFF